MQPNTPLLSPAEQQLYEYLRGNHQRANFAVARRQRWHKLLDFLKRALERLNSLNVALVRQQHHATGLWLAGTGVLTEQQIGASEWLNKAEKKQCHALRELWQRAAWLPVADGLPDPMPREYSGADDDEQEQTADYEVWVNGGLRVARLYGVGERRTWYAYGEPHPITPTHYRPIIGPAE